MKIYDVHGIGEKRHVKIAEYFPGLEENSMVPPDKVPISAVPALIAQLAAYQVQLAMRLASTATVSEPVSIADPEGQMLTVKEVPARLNLSVKSVYRKAKDWPFARRIDGSWRFSQRGLAAVALDLRRCRKTSERLTVSNTSVQVLHLREKTKFEDSSAN